MWLKHVACRSAAADLPRKRPTVQQCPGHLLTPLAPISISGLAEGAICSKCSPVPVNCVLCGVYMVALQRHPEKAINQLRLQSESHQAHLWNTLRHHHFWTNDKLLYWKAGSVLYRLENYSPHIIKTAQTRKLWRTSMNRGRQTPQAWITKTPRMGSVPSNLLIEFFFFFWLIQIHISAALRSWWRFVVTKHRVSVHHLRVVMRLFLSIQFWMHTREAAFCTSTWRCDAHKRRNKILLNLKETTKKNPQLQGDGWHFKHTIASI